MRIQRPRGTLRGPAHPTPLVVAWWSLTVSDLTTRARRPLALALALAVSRWGVFCRALSRDDVRPRTGKPARRLAFQSPRGPSTYTGLVEAPGIEPGSRDAPHALLRAYPSNLKHPPGGRDGPADPGFTGEVLAPHYPAVGRRASRRRVALGSDTGGTLSGPGRLIRRPVRSWCCQLLLSRVLRGHREPRHATSCGSHPVEACRPRINTYCSRSRGSGRETGGR